jgi:hypothetical protein
MVPIPKVGWIILWMTRFARTIGPAYIYKGKWKRWDILGQVCCSIIHYQ